ncbi:MAG: substrate-binding domain-containing protein [Woeseiaceae bacterium]
MVAVTMVLAACSSPPGEPPVRQDPVVVYAAFEDDARIVAVLERYKQETGVLVIVRRGPAQRIVNDLIDNDVSPPADVLMTRSVVDIWRAAEESALRPMFSDEVSQRVPAWARDPDDLWFATAVRTAVIAHTQQMPLPDSAPDIRSLADPQYSGALCLTTSRSAGNRAIVAGLISEIGGREAELVVRGWIGNLAVPPFEDNARLLEALESGQCRYGIAVDAVPAAEPHATGAVAISAWPADVEAIGIGRHAKNPEGAVALIEWLFRQHEFSYLPDPDASQQSNISAVAWHYEEAIKLVERARYP